MSLVLSMIYVSGAAPAAAAGAVPVRDLPLGPASPGPASPAPVASEVDTGALGSLSERSSFDPARSQLVSRSMSGEEWANPDGTHTIRQSSVPMNVPDSAGGWQAINTTLRVERTGRLHSGPHPLSPSFAASASDSALLSMRVPTGPSADIALEQAAPVPARMSTDDATTVSYESVLPNTDLRYQIGAGTVKETLVLRDRPEPGQSSWRFRLTTNGLTPVPAEGGVELRDANGVAQVIIPPVQAWDSSGNEDAPPAITGGSYTVDNVGGKLGLTAQVDENWLRAPERVFPVFVDPTMSFGVIDSRWYQSNGESRVRDGIRVGNSRVLRPDNTIQDVYNRSIIKWDYRSLFGRNVVGARAVVVRDTAFAGSRKSWPVDLWHANAFAYDGVGRHLAEGVFGDDGVLTGDGLVPFLRQLVAARDDRAWFMLTGHEVPGVWTFKHFNITLQVDVGAAPPAAALVAPADNTVLTTQTPTLRVSPVSDPDGEPVKYCFRVSSGADVGNGVVVDSGCRPTPSWQVPPGVLADGAAYVWQAWTTSGITTTKPPWTGHFRVDLRVGDRGPAPVDEFAGVAVNLANGNVSVSAASPEFPAVGGSAAVSFAYNSQQAGTAGLTAEYYADANRNGAIDDGAQPSLVRTEPQVNIDYGLGTPITPGLPADWWVARWTGFFQAPRAGTYQFAGVHDDAMRVWVGATQVYTGTGPSDLNWTDAHVVGSVTLTAGQRVPIRVELTEATGKASARLFTRTTDGGVAAQVVDAGWLFGSDSPALPHGWTLSADLDGDGTGYVSAHLADQTVVLTDGSGGKTTWTRRTPAGNPRAPAGFLPPAGEDGVLAVDSAGKVTLHDGDEVFVFSTDGRLESQSTVLDGQRPAALRYVYDGAPRRLREIRDPVSGRALRLHYNRTGDDCLGGLTRPPGADQAAPSQMLCRIAYWDGSQTVLWYRAGQLSRIEDPGAELTDFGYGAGGLLDRVRDALAADWTAVAPAIRDNDTAWTQIGYTVHSGRTKATVVTAPAPRPGEPRPARTYEYVSANETRIQVAGLSPATGFAEKVTFDDAWRETSTTDGTGVTTSTEWNAKDQPVATVDAADRKSTTGYDHADREIDKYGPAPRSCFTGQLPTAACANSVPHEHTDHDQGMPGLAAAYYNNRIATGAPVAYGTGVGESTGAVFRNWGAAAPVPGVTVDNWSLRLSGEITLPDAGAYQFRIFSDDGTRLWIDDTLVVDGWSDGPAWRTGAYTNTAGASSVHRIRLDYNDLTSTARLELHWVRPNNAGSGAVPGSVLRPRYGLTTRDTDHDSGGDAPTEITATDYDQPHLQLDTASTADPGGLALTARTGREPAGTGYLRETASALPGGDLADPARRTSTVYYGDAETRDNPCTPAVDPANQAGAAKTVTDPRPAAGSARVTETVYDAAGRPVATRIGADPWTCTGYDARGRTIRVDHPAFGGHPARTVTTDHAAGGDPLATRTTDPIGSITETVDLLGRTVSYTDTTGATTATEYDRAGRAVAVTTRVGEDTSAVAYGYDDADRVTTVRLDGQPLATAGYHPTSGELRSVTYGNNTALSAVGRDDAGRTTSLSWAFPGGGIVTDTVTRSRTGKTLTGTVTDAGNVVARNGFRYDAAGRLVGASIPHHRLAYRFDQTSASCPAPANARAGANTNRTAVEDSLDGAAPVITRFCYDQADRLHSMSGGLSLQPGYDAHGNTVSLGGDTMRYDGANRHQGTATAAGLTVGYVRDAQDRLAGRSVTGAPDPADNTGVRYGYTADGDTADLVLSGESLVERLLPLPGGVLLTKTYDDAAATAWAYPNIHGDVLVTAGQAGARTGGIYLYDPHGRTIDPATGAYTDVATPHTAAGGLDYGWLGQHQRPTEHRGAQPAVEMGARTYLPVLGRFLQVDPVEGGSANNYDYTNADPVNDTDLDGNWSLKKWAKKKWKKAKRWGKKKWRGFKRWSARKAWPAIKRFGKWTGRNLWRGAKYFARGLRVTFPGWLYCYVRRSQDRDNSWRDSFRDAGRCANPFR